MFARGTSMDFGEFVKLLQHLGLVSEVRGTTGIVPKDQAAQIFKQVNLHTAEEEADDQEHELGRLRCDLHPAADTLTLTDRF